MANFDPTQMKLGSITSPVDRRDFMTSAIIPQDIQVPRKLSFKDKIKTMIDQKQYGICAGCAGSNIKNEQEVVDNAYPVNGFSPVYLYTLAKQIDGIPTIEGTYPRTIMQILASKGALPYDDMPVSVLDSLSGKLPNITQDQINKALPNKILSYAQVPNDINMLKQALLVTQSPIMISIAVTKSFYYPEQNKFVAKPSGNMYGGHAIDIIGYDDDMTYTYADGTKETGFVEIVNSWSTDWGNGGFIYIPYSSLNWTFPANNYIYPFIFEMWSAIDDHSNAPKPPKYWRIQCGAFSFTNKNGVQNEQIRLKALGLPTYLVLINNLWKIQLGAFISEEKCRAESLRIKGLNVKNFVVNY